MPFLSKIFLNPLRTGAQAMVRNPQVTHAAVLGGLSQQPVNERVLWRLEPDVHRSNLLVLTQSRPSWEHIVEQAGWASADEPQALVRPYELLLDRVVDGTEFAFKLVANPTYATKNPLNPSVAQKEKLSAGRSRGVRVAHRTAAHQLTWCTDRIGKWGFEFTTSADGYTEVRVDERASTSFSKKNSAGGRNQVTQQRATFLGKVRVINADAARNSLLNGVGSSKSYGCGLITLAPLSTHTNNH